MHIALAVFADPALRALIALHFDGMREGAPPEHCHVLDLSGLERPDIALYTLHLDGRLAGMGALRALNARTGEIKSMRTHPAFVRRGVGAAILDHLIGEAAARGYQAVCLETGTDEKFVAALALYHGRGFVSGPAFGEYEPSPHNQFLYLTRERF
ncbi:MAG TPA: N-acetyltransferase [Alphaproteobacteria bacterium]|nr:N-acetyltransferase [Alphaproteobacteria bacterium]HAJ46266.1 N-acetyltransferase [Alphaproteobacteria bacterium]